MDFILPFVFFLFLLFSENCFFFLILFFWLLLLSPQKADVSVSRLTCTSPPLTWHSSRWGSHGFTADVAMASPLTCPVMTCRRVFLSFPVSFLPRRITHDTWPQCPLCLLRYLQKIGLPFSFFAFSSISKSRPLLLSFEIYIFKQKQVSVFGVYLHNWSVEFRLVDWGSWIRQKQT